MSVNPFELVRATATRLLCALLPAGVAACGTWSVDPNADLVIFGARVWDGTGRGHDWPGGRAGSERAGSSPSNRNRKARTSRRQLRWRGSVRLMRAGCMSFPA